MGKLTIRMPTASLARNAANAGHLLATQHLLGAALALVPIEEHTLEQSGAADVDTANLEAAVTFDGPYAKRQHEELGWRHDPGRTAKYLERPSITEAGTIGQIMATAAKRALS